MYDFVIKIDPLVNAITQAADELENVGDPEEIFNNLIEWDDIPDAVLWQVLTELDVEEAAPIIL